MSKQAGLEIDGEFIDLVPGTVINLEEQNIFLQLDENIIGDYTMPFEAVVNEKNLRLTDYNSVINATGIIKKDARLWDGDIQHSRGTAKVEKLKSNLNDIKKGRISLFFLKDASSFYQDIKDRKLTDLTLPEYTLPATGTSLLNFVNNAWKNNTSDTHDYTFFPVMGSQFSINAFSGNHIFNYARFDSPSTPDSLMPIWRDRNNGYFNEFVPFMYLKNVMVKIFEEAGWTLDGSILNDADFKKICIIHFALIEWRWQSDAFPAITGIHPSPLKIKLAKHLPNMNQSTFLIEIQNRLGIWFDFDSSLRIATIRYRKDVFTSVTPTDISAIVAPRYERNVLEQNVIYALGNTGLEDSFDFSTYTDQGSLLVESSLPVASSSNVNHLYFIRSRNKFVACLNVTGNAYAWVDVTQNTFGVYPLNNTKKVQTSAYISSMIEFDETIGGNNTKYWIPYVPDESPTSFSTDNQYTDDHFYLAFYHGVHNDSVGKPYAYASPYPYNVAGTLLTAWSLSFQFNDNGTNRGLYELNWKPFLDTITQKEKYTFTVFTDIATWRNLSFGQLVVISGVQFYLQNKKSQIPFNGFATIDCSRIV